MAWKAPLFGWVRNHSAKAVAELVQVHPKGAHVHIHRAGAIRFPQLAHALTREHERHPPPLVLLDPVERAADRRKEGGQKQIVRDYSGSCCGKVFFMHLCAPFGRWITAAGERSRD